MKKKEDKSQNTSQGDKTPSSRHFSSNLGKYDADKRHLISNHKLDDIRYYHNHSHTQLLTTGQGLPITDDMNSLKIGSRGPTLLQDFQLQEKLAHFNRERIPERVVHARGTGAHGVFRVYRSLASYTTAAFLQDPETETPVFVRFSTVQGFRGSPDTVRDIRGFATKFYTREGNYDLVGNNTPVFFIQDAIKFPDFVHAVKPEPHTEMPQGQSAHDSFWDFVSLQPETLHNVMWAMSDRGIPRSYRMMEGFGIHTFKFVNATGKVTFVRFHWKPMYGKRSLLWDESQELTGRDPDYHRRDLIEAIDAGDFPEYELGVQLIAEDELNKLSFDILDPTKLIPESLIPVELIGKMTLNRNPDNVFAETEQVAFSPANIVPGIDFSDDPLLQGRIFAYSDANRYRLGGANFNEIPINRPLFHPHNNQRDGQHRMQINIAHANYSPNSIEDNYPRECSTSNHGFVSIREPISGIKVRERSESFSNYYSQPRLFWNSQSLVEQEHIISAFSFELAKVTRPYIRERIVDLLSNIDTRLAGEVANQLGITLSAEQLSRPAPMMFDGIISDPALSLFSTPCLKGLKTLRVAVPIFPHVSSVSVTEILAELKKEGIYPKLLSSKMGIITSIEGDAIEIDGTFEGNPSLFFDAVIVPNGEYAKFQLPVSSDFVRFIHQTWRHLKPIAFHGEASEILNSVNLNTKQKDHGIIAVKNSHVLMVQFFAALRNYRIWDRNPLNCIH